jgi:hypothetical protein
MVTKMAANAMMGVAMCEKVRAHAFALLCLVAPDFGRSSISSAANHQSKTPPPTSSYQSKVQRANQHIRQDCGQVLFVQIHIPRFIALYGSIFRTHFNAQSSAHPKSFVNSNSGSDVARGRGSAVRWE